MVVRLFLLCVLALPLSSCASLRKPEVVFVPPKLDCGIFEVPKVNPPTDPALYDKDPAVWQLWGLSWQAVAEHIHGQRLETARCVAKLREEGIVK